MIKQQLGDRLDGWIHTAFPFLFVRPLNPDLLTVIGAIGSIAAAGYIGGKVVGAYNIIRPARRHYYQSFDYVFQFAHITRPVICLQGGYGTFGKGANRLPGAPFGLR